MTFGNPDQRKSERRERPAIEGALCQTIIRLEKEKAELVEALHAVVRLEFCIGRSFSLLPDVEHAKDVLAKHAPQKEAQT